MLGIARNTAPMQPPRRCGSRRCPDGSRTWERVTGEPSWQADARVISADVPEDRGSSARWLAVRPPATLAVPDASVTASRSASYVHHMRNATGSSLTSRSRLPARPSPIRPSSPSRTSACSPSWRRATRELRVALEQADGDQRAAQGDRAGPPSISSRSSRRWPIVQSGCARPTRRIHLASTVRFCEWSSPVQRLAPRLREFLERNPLAPGRQSGAARRPRAANDPHPRYPDRPRLHVRDADGRGHPCGPCSHPDAPERTSCWGDRRLPGRGPAVHRQSDRPHGDLRRPGRHRHRERAAAHRGCRPARHELTRSVAGSCRRWARSARPSAPRSTSRPCSARSSPAPNQLAGADGATVYEYDERAEAFHPCAPPTSLDERSGRRGPARAGAAG